MRDALGENLRRLNWSRIRKRRITVVLLVLSLLVSLDVFWMMRQPGLTLAGDATCGIQEHKHKEECSQTVCICEQSEEVHVHGDDCYEIHFHEAQEVRQIICEVAEEGHEHSEECFITEIIEAYEEKNLICNLSEEAHIHEDACYEKQWICELEEHVHSIECYSDETADVETPLDWQEMFAHYPYTGNLREDLVGIAKSQVGYAESERNFVVEDDGSRQGYTRYGAWYGTPYRDWSALFVSFCLNYAGADATQVPGNTGASAMTTHWDKLEKYASAGEYVPVAGDLVFFNDNTVGIVTDVQNATIYVVCGDIEDAVKGMSILMSDESIIGWGSTEGKTIAESEPEDLVSKIPEEELEGPEKQEKIPEEIPVMLKAPNQIQEEESEGSEEPEEILEEDIIELMSYLEKQGGTYTFTLVDEQSKEVANDGHGNYIVEEDTLYYITLNFYNPNGYEPVTYQYQVPNGQMIEPGSGEFILTDKTYVGDWVVTEDGLITITFNNNINNRSKITLSAEMGIKFPHLEQPIDFDGKITVTLEKPEEEEIVTEIYKWGEQGTGEKENKIAWTILINGRKDSHIPGSVLTDEVLLGDHRYTQSDMENGISIGASQPDPVTGAEIAWHEWKVYPGDPNLTWTEDGWSYTIPEVAPCIYCGGAHLGNDNWIYYIKYTSTPDVSTIAGEFYYMNRAEVDKQVTEGGATFMHGELEGNVVKNGTFHGDAEGGVFLWEFQATVPGIKEGQKAENFWYIMDYLEVRDEEDDTIDSVTNDIDKARITANNNGIIYEVPHVNHASNENLFAWYNSYSPIDEYGNHSVRQIDLLCRCGCTEENCQFWRDGKCDNQYWFQAENGKDYTNGFCQCWTLTGSTIFTFSYETEDLSVIGAHGGFGNVLRNEAVLYNKNVLPNGTWDGVRIAGDQDAIPIPGMIEKEVTKRFDGYVAHYNITINESKVTMTGDSSFTIYDEMSETLVYISGSMVIKTEDVNGNVETLQYGVDYNLTYNGSGHKLEIEILRPQPVMYILDYDTTLLIPDGASKVQYNNAATISIWGQELTDFSEEKTYTDINIAASKYQVEVSKTSTQTGEPLGGAVFGLYNEQGGLIKTGETNDDGKILFETDVINGIILRDHVLYYLQELKAPSKYMLDDTKHWFCFCDNKEETCETCDEVMEGKDAFRIPYEELGIADIKNELRHMDLPSTGGIGVLPIIYGSITLVLTSLILEFIRRRKQEGRDLG